MELMDDSLTHFLEGSSQPIPYHIQVNICCDIALALSFLHSNSIFHRDLSSNNVLLIGKAWQSRFTVYRHSISCFACGRAVIIHISYRKCYYGITSFYTIQETTNQLDHHRPRNYAAIAAGDLNRHQLFSLFFTF